MQWTMALDDIDAAGVAFAPRLIALAHLAVERRLAGSALDFAQLVRDGRYALPIVAVAAEFRLPLRHGEAIALRVVLADRGPRSARLRTDLVVGDGRIAASVAQTHACLDRAAGVAVAWPEAMQSALAALEASAER